MGPVRYTEFQTLPLSWTSPLVVALCYLLSLTFFVISHQVYMNPDFRTLDYRIDPFQLFLIPFVLSAILLVFPITIITGLLIFLKPWTVRRS